MEIYLHAPSIHTVRAKSASSSNHDSRHKYRGINAKLIIGRLLSVESRGYFTVCSISTRKIKSVETALAIKSQPWEVYRGETFRVHQRRGSFKSEILSEETCPSWSESNSAPGSATSYTAAHRLRRRPREDCPAADATWGELWNTGFKGGYTPSSSSQACPTRRRIWWVSFKIWPKIVDYAKA